MSCIILLVYSLDEKGLRDTGFILGDVLNKLKTCH